MQTFKYLRLWTLPECYAGPVYPDTYDSGFGQNRDSDCLGRSNFRTAWKAISDVSDNVQIIRERHWAVGWIEWIAIPASETAALAVAEELNRRYDGYPVLNEEDFSELESEEAEIVWRDCYNTKERIAYIRDYRDQFDFRSLAAMLECARGKYFAGYASELL